MELPANRLPQSKIEISRVKDGIPTDEELELLADQLGQNWKKLGRRLVDVPDPQLQEIDQAHDQISEKGYFMLKHWKQEKGSAATYQALCDALKHKLVQRQDLAEQFCYIHEKRSSRRLLKRKKPHPSKHHPSAKCSRSAALDIRIDVDTMKRKEHKTQDRTVSESEGSQGPERQAASAVPVSSGQTQASCKGDDVHQVPNPICSKASEILCFIAENYLENSPPKCKADRDDFLAYMKEMRIIITGVEIGSLLITVKCDSLQILERLWEDYSSGHLGEVVQKSFVTEKILTTFSLAELKLKTTISEGKYKACKKYLWKDPARAEGDETDDDDDSVSDDEGTIQRLKEIQKSREGWQQRMKTLNQGRQQEEQIVEAVPRPRFLARCSVM